MKIYSDCKYVVGMDKDTKAMKFCGKTADTVVKDVDLCDNHSKYTLWPITDWWKLKD